jgi:hypothetical protein
MTRLRARVATALSAALIALSGRVIAHSGPPFPLISDRVAGPYELSIWTDPDATDDRSPAGQFWVTIRLADGSAVPSDTHAVITIRPMDRPGPAESAPTMPVHGDVSRQFAAVVMNHEGLFSVEARISSARGLAVVDAKVDATYDTRPARWLLALYVMPFLAVGFLWIKLLISRRLRSQGGSNPRL